MAQIKITLTKSPIGRKPEQRKTVVALGLGKLNSSVVKRRQRCYPWYGQRSISLGNCRRR